MYSVCIHFVETQTTLHFWFLITFFYFSVLKRKEKKRKIIIINLKIKKIDIDIFVAVLGVRFVLCRSKHGFSGL